MALDKALEAELKAQLEAEKEKIESELGRFASRDEDGTFSSDFPENLGTEQSENANEVEEYTDRLAVENTLETRLTDITDALARIEAGTYGVDEETGEDIDEARLRAYPAARTNVR